MKYSILFLSVLLFSCAPKKMIPLKGQYPSTPMIFNSEKSFSEIWDNLVDVFAQKGLSIKIIDRSSGLIISDKSKLSSTMEDKNGIMFDPNAFIAVPSYISNGKRVPVYKPFYGSYATQNQILNSMMNDCYGEWNVRVKSIPNGGCSINVNITNIVYQDWDTKLHTNVSTPISDIKSTGVFEKQLADLINK